MTRVRRKVEVNRGDSEGELWVVRSPKSQPSQSNYFSFFPQKQAGMLTRRDTHNKHVLLCGVLRSVHTTFAEKEINIYARCFG